MVAERRSLVAVIRDLRMPREERRLMRQERRRVKNEATAQGRAAAIDAESRRHQSFWGGG